MRLVGQRWRYIVGNAKIDVDHAFSRTFWVQERLRVDDKTVLASGARWRPFKLWNQAWRTPVEKGTLAITLRSRLLGMACSAEWEGEELTPAAQYEASWDAPAHGWPADDLWTECRTGSPPAG